jgi:crotonobetainyl-CoA:carnitine CoA-transferase CaiB-like acyl-CoA transferase
MAILAALYDREHTGEGQAIDIALMDSQLAVLAEAAAPALAKGREETWVPFRHGLQATKDGYLAVNLGAPANWQRIAAAMGQPDRPLPADRAIAERAIEEWAAELTTGEAVAALEAAGAPYGVMRSIHDALEHPYFEERGMIVEVPDAVSGSAKVVASPFFFSRASAVPRGGAPLAGEHTREILREAGRSEEEIEALLAQGVVGEQVRAAESRSSAVRGEG